MEEKLPKYLEYAFLAMAVVSSVTCLARTDFNFAFALLFYYLWHKANALDENKEGIGKKILILNVVIGVLDLIWLIVMGSVWHSKPSEGSVAWEHLAGIHTFALFLSWFNWFLRVRHM